MMNATGSFAGNWPEENCTERTVELDDDERDAEATAAEVGDENETGVLGVKSHPTPGSVISNLPVEGMEHSGTRATVIVT